MKHPEYQLQVAVCKYLSVQYRGVDFLSDTIASVKLTMRQAARNKAIQKADFKCPDLLILTPNMTYHGLFIELKVASPFKANGEIKASQNNHLELQYKQLKKFNNRGYYACFAWDFEMAKKIIDNYFKNTL
jgi:hypothetical protein